jgi:hypothetical protein
VPAITAFVRAFFRNAGSKAGMTALKGRSTFEGVWLAVKSNTLLLFSQEPDYFEVHLRPFSGATGLRLPIRSVSFLARTDHR